MSIYDRDFLRRLLPPALPFCLPLTIVRLVMDFKEVVSLNSRNIASDSSPDRIDAFALMKYQDYLSYGNDDNLHVAIVCAMESIERARASGIIDRDSLNNLSMFLSSRYRRTGDPDDLEEAIKLGRHVLEITPYDHFERGGFLRNLSDKLYQRYKRAGDVEDLEEAIRTAREAVHIGTTRLDEPECDMKLINLAAKLNGFYKRTRQLSVLEEAIDVARQAVQSASEDNRTTCLDILGEQLIRRYKRTKAMLDRRTKAMLDLDDAIKMSRDALAATAFSNPGRKRRLNILGSRLLIRYKQKRHKGDLAEAIEKTEEAVNDTPQDHPLFAQRLMTLAKMIDCLYDHTKEISDLTNAVTMATKAVDITPLNHPARASVLHTLANILIRRHGRKRRHSQMMAAARLCQEAASCFNAPSFDRIRAATHGMELFAMQDNFHDGIKVGLIAFELLPVIHTRLLSRSDQQFILSEYAGVASNLCAFLLSTGRLYDALECLERGRAVIISQMLDDRSDFSALTIGHPFLSARYQTLVDNLNCSAQEEEDRVARDDSIDIRGQAAAALDSCLADIRAMPGYERFLLGQTVNEMQQCAMGGSVIMVNVTHFQSDAIVVSQRSVNHIPLPDLSIREAKKWLSRQWLSKRHSQQRALNDGFLEYLAWLWNTCVKLILDYITPNRMDDTQYHPHVWWIGCGLASSMPFHAAGLHYDGSTETAYDRVISSYTPSIKALSHAQQRVRRGEPGLKRVLVAAMPTTPKGLPGQKSFPNLDGVIPEKDRLLQALPSNIRANVLMSPSVDELLEVLPQCHIAHFACHGISDTNDPSRSGLVFQKADSQALVEQDFLSVDRLSSIQLKCAQIAYLSACSTAENKANMLLDEVIHVVSGFQVAGFPHVVGCLWPAGDSECVEISQKFYSLILGQGHSSSSAGHVASALREAVMAVRRNDINMPLNWAQFVHFGA